MVRLALCNCSPEEAPSLAKRLVEEELAACVNLIEGVRSFYRWEGQLCDDEEVTLLIKTTAGCYEKMARTLAQHHSYDVPEIIALDPEEVSSPYAEWVHDQVE